MARILRRFPLPVLLAAWAVGPLSADAQRQTEELGRGVIAVPREDGSVLVSWRLLGTDPSEVAFDVYRSVDEKAPIRLNSSPVQQSTNWLDQGVPSAGRCRYWVQPVIDGQRVIASRPYRLVRGQPYLSIPLRTPPGYTPNDASVGDLTGDGEYEIVLQQTGRSRDNSQAGFTDPPILEAYRLDGTFLWRIHLGRNIREGAHYTQMVVYDLDGDGRAEIACKTADGTLDGQGNVLGDLDADHRNQDGCVLDGPEWMTVFDGPTGAALATVDYIPPRGDVRSWGDGSGNRVDRFLAAVAYLDGRRPSLIMCRVYYTRSVVAAWNYRDGQLSHVWTFDSDDGTPGNGDYRGQGNHSLSVGDVDGDGCDEIIYGACAIDHDGTGLYTTRLGHGDAMHLADIDPDRPGLEVWGIHEKPRHPFGANLRDAATGRVIWGLPLKDPGRGLAMDIDPRHRGYECWTNDSDGLYGCQGNKISDRKPRSCNMGIWWDGDLLRELLDGSDARRRGGAFIDKWDYERATTVRLLSGTDFDCVTNNGTKANPCLVADILGDWREEVIWRTRDNQELRVFSTPIPTDVRLTTLMHDPVYRLGIAWQNVGYNQPAHPSFYLGVGRLSAVP
jgi:rhamnogalacturonan endolyase